MKILYEVQATGKGYITRARVMAPALDEAGVDVDYLFSAFPAYDFCVYSKIEKLYVHDNVVFRPLSPEKLEKDLSLCDGVISSCGFGLSSEAMQYGKKFLSKPMKGQMEQQSNAYIMKTLGLATVIRECDVEIIDAWLQLENPVLKSFLM